MPIPARFSQFVSAVVVLLAFQTAADARTLPRITPDDSLIRIPMRYYVPEVSKGNVERDNGSPVSVQTPFSSPYYVVDVS